jgi:branched-chain amino acid transport system substrate-binding protein
MSTTRPRAARAPPALCLAAVASLAAGCGGGKKSDEAPQLKGAVTFGVLAPVARVGEFGTRAKDLTDGAKLAVNEINAGGGVLGRKLQLEVVDDACSAPVAYEAAKAFLSDDDVAGVIGGMCDEAAEREVPVIDSTGIPFLVTSATADDLVNQDTQSTYLMNGTVYQQALSATFWMNYKQATRLAVFQDSTPESKDLAQQTIGLVDETPKVVGLQTVDPGDPNLETIAKAALVSKPNFVYWTGAAATGGALAKALKDAGYKGTFTASAASESPEFLKAAGPDGAEGAFVTATATGENTPTAARWTQQFKLLYKRDPGLDALQAYDAVRTLAHSIQKAKSTDGAKVLKRLQTVDTSLTNFLGVVRFAADHTLLYDNRVILEVKKGAFAWNRSLRTDSLQ